jgi:hypothetical protein
MDLEVGKLDARFEEAATHALQPRGLIYSAEWRGCPPRIASFDILNLASVCAFLEYVASLPGTKGYVHMPTHSFDIWLPIDFEPTAEPELSDEGWPVPLLSSYRLLKELEEIQRIASLKLGDAPAGYDLMRSNPREFYKSDVTLDETAMLQWIWKGLYDTAEMSIARSAPVFAAE